MEASTLLRRLAGGLASTLGGVRYSSSSAWPCWPDFCAQSASGSQGCSGCAHSRIRYSNPGSTTIGIGSGDAGATPPTTIFASTGMNGDCAGIGAVTITYRPVKGRPTDARNPTMKPMSALTAVIVLVIVEAGAVGLFAFGVHEKGWTADAVCDVHTFRHAGRDTYRHHQLVAVRQQEAIRPDNQPPATAARTNPDEAVPTAHEPG